MVKAFGKLIKASMAWKVRKSVGEELASTKSKVLVDFLDLTNFGF